ncbi:MAG: hypothetical protein KJ886_02540 [Candidatus Thermoplasmatota archaeon]|nr:hypothetical protein [Candidatus Thermoplasmatota archaeon]MBU4256777.1 hypothetical protein [Candidatus Thermoplasmatota archaeon]
MQNTNENNLSVQVNRGIGAVSGLVGWNTTKYLSGFCPVCGQTMVVHLEEHQDGFTYMDRRCICGYSEVVG